MNSENKREAPLFINWYDSITPEGNDFKAEQSAITKSIGMSINDFNGSGVLNTTPIDLAPLLNTAKPSATNFSKNVLLGGSFDGVGICVDRQPTDTVYGNQLLVTLSGANVKTLHKPKAIIFGKVYDPDEPSGVAKLEILSFDDNEEKVTYNYFVSVICVLFNNFSGGAGRTEILNQAESVQQEGQPIITITEVGPLKVVEHSIVSEQILSPNVDIRDFVTSTPSRRFVDELAYVVNYLQNKSYGATATLNDISKLLLDVSGNPNLPALDSTNPGVILGEKVYLPTNNIQQLSLLMSLESGSSWSGELVIGLRKLQTKSINQFASRIDLEPESFVLFEAAFSYNDLLELGYTLDSTLQEVKFNFIGTPISNPGAVITGDDYYMVTISRRGDISTGKIKFGVGTNRKSNSRFTAFNPQNRRWVDDATADLWFKLNSSAIRVTAGAAYTNEGAMVAVKKTKLAEDGKVISHIEGPLSLATTDVNAGENIVVLEGGQGYEMPAPHQITGNLTYKRKYNRAFISVHSKSTFEELLDNTNNKTKNNPPLVLAVIKDVNSKQDAELAGIIDRVGQLSKNKAYLFDSALTGGYSTEELENILNGKNKIFIPDTTNPTTRYRIRNAKISDIYLGDFNNDGLISSSDLEKENDIFDTFQYQSNNTSHELSDSIAKDIVCYDEVSIKDFVLADIDSNGKVDSTDVGAVETYSESPLPMQAQKPDLIRVYELTLDNVGADSDITVFNSLNPTAQVVSSSEVYFEVATLQDLRAISVGDKLSLSSDNFQTEYQSNLIISSIVHRNDALFEVLVPGAVTLDADNAYVLSFFSQVDPTEQTTSVPDGGGATADFYIRFEPTSPVVGEVTASWISAGAPKKMTFASDLSVTGDGDLEGSSVDRLNGTMELKTGNDVPDNATSITITYFYEPILTLKKCYAIDSMPDGQNTRVKFKVPHADSQVDLSDIGNASSIQIQLSQMHPPDLIKDDSDNDVESCTLVGQTLQLPQLVMRAAVTKSDGTAASLQSPDANTYYIKILSGEPVNMAAKQKLFVSNDLVAVEYKIEQLNFEWTPFNLKVHDVRRFLPSVFKNIDDTFNNKNNSWVPSDLYLTGGELLKAPGVPYHGDIEITKINIDLPIATLLSNSINVYETLIASRSAKPGKTLAGYNAMRFSDGTYVGADDVGQVTALTKNQVRVIPSIGSLNIRNSKIPGEVHYVDVDEVITKLKFELRMGMYFDDQTGMLYFHGEGLRKIIDNEPFVQTTTVRLVLDVALKKCAFKNNIVNINSQDVVQLFSGSFTDISEPKYSISGEMISGDVVGVD